MPPAIHRRLPLSCEPCRTRKIKCPRVVGGNGPCATCVRRGLPSHACVFLGQHTSSQMRAPSETLEIELLSRISNLEALLRVNENGSGRSNISTQQSIPLSPFSILHGAQLNHRDHQEAHVMTPSASESSPSTSSTYFQDSGKLRQLPSGHIQYEPRTCNWNHIINSHSDLVPLIELDSGTEDAMFPFRPRSRVNVAEMLEALPPTSQCHELKTVFFNVFSPLFHILHDPTFDAEYETFKHEPEAVPFTWLALLFVVLSIAVTALDDSSSTLADLGRSHSSSQNIALLSSRYRAAAMQCLEADGFLWRHNLHTVQALILMIYGINHSHGKTWALLGLTYNIALAIGCHIDPERLNLDVVQSEQRRRCWAALQILYTVQSAFMGYMPSQILTHNVRLPADANDWDLYHHTSCRKSDAPTQMTYILAKFRLYSIATRICEQIFGDKYPTYDSILALDETISAEQDIWNTRYLSDTHQDHFPVYHTVHLNILYAYSHQLYLLLHRPVLLNVSKQYNVPQLRKSVDRCVSSATGLLSIHKSTHECKDYTPYRWYNEGLGSFQAFHAVIALVALLLRAEDSCIYHNVAMTLRLSVRVFKEMAGRSQICAKAAPLIEKLITAVASRYERDGNPFPNPVPLEHSFSSFSTEQLDAFNYQLRPELWLNPSSIAWPDWDFLTAQ